MVPASPAAVTRTDDDWDFTRRAAVDARAPDVRRAGKHQKL